MAETPQEQAARSVRSDWAELCLHYPQYRLEEVPDMADGDIQLLLAVARIEKLRTQRMMLEAFGAAQSQKGYNKLRGKIKENISKHEERI